MNIVPGEEKGAIAACYLPSLCQKGFFWRGPVKSEITAGGTGVVTDRARRWFSSSHRSLAGLSCSVLRSPPRASPLTATQGEEHLLEGRGSSLVNWVVPGFGGACAWRGGPAVAGLGGCTLSPFSGKGVTLESPQGSRLTLHSSSTLTITQLSANREIRGRTRRLCCIVLLSLHLGITSVEMLARNYALECLDSEKLIKAEQCRTVSDEYKKQHLAWPQGNFPLQQRRPHLGRASSRLAGLSVVAGPADSGRALRDPSIPSNHSDS